MGEFKSGNGVKRTGKNEIGDQRTGEKKSKIRGEKLASRDDLYVLVVAERDQIAAVAGDDDVAMAINRAFQNPVVSRAARDRVDGAHGHDNFCYRKDGTDQCCNLFLAQVEFFGVQDSFDLVHERC